MCLGEIGFGLGLDSVYVFFVYTIVVVYIMNICA